MAETLYRKYRPQTFAELVNQKHIRVTLENEISTGQIAHAYLFSGPRGIGKTTVARLLGKALNCQKREGSEPCNQCDNCQAVKAGRFLDLIEIDAASNRGINEIRELREHVKYPPSKGLFKIFIIDEVHMLTPEAFNALLKTLEEPPKQTIFILATTEIHKVPDTIISRCQRFDFKKVDLKDIAERLAYISQQEKVSIEPKVLELIARRSGGFIRDAESLLGQIFSLGEKEITEETVSVILPRSDFSLIIELVNNLKQKDTASGLILINKLVNEGVDLFEFNKDVIEYLRKLLILKVEGSISEFMTVTLEKELNEQAIKQVEKEVKKYNHSLHFILKLCLPGKFDGKKLEICLKYKIHQEKLKDNKAKELIEQAIKKISQKDIQIVPVLDTELDLKACGNGNGDEAVDDALDVFGGTVVQ